MEWSKWWEPKKRKDGKYRYSFRTDPKNLPGKLVSGRRFSVNEYFSIDILGDLSISPSQWQVYEWEPVYGRRPRGSGGKGPRPRLVWRYRHADGFKSAEAAWAFVDREVR